MELKRSQVRITPKRAEELLRLNTYAGQRNKSPMHIQELAEKMKDGRFHNGQVAIVINGSTFLADGQHQCEASIVSGVTFPATMLEFYAEKGDSKEDIAEVFAQFNVDRSRTRGDIAWIYGCQVGMHEWPRKCVTLCNSALGWIAGGFGEGGVRLGKDENARLLSAKKSACTFVRDIAFSGDPKQSRHLQRGAVVAAMIVTQQKDAEAARAFWEAVRDGDMLRKSDPCAVIRDFLLRTSVALGAGARGDKVTVGAREMFGKCIAAWNAKRSGKTTSLKYFGSKPLPKLV
jgi:hypothetical protein